MQPCRILVVNCGRHLGEDIDDVGRSANRLSKFASNIGVDVITALPCGEDLFRGKRHESVD